MQLCFMLHTRTCTLVPTVRPMGPSRSPRPGPRWDELLGACAWEEGFCSRSCMGWRRASVAWHVCQTLDCVPGQAGWGKHAKTRAGALWGAKPTLKDAPRAPLTASNVCNS